MLINQNKLLDAIGGEARKVDGVQLHNPGFNPVEFDGINGTPFMQHLD